MCTDFQSQESKARIMLINTAVAGVAIDLDAADDLVILDETYIPDDQEQLEDRAHRISRVHQLTIHKPRMLGTIEEEVAFVSAARQDEQRYILDGIRGVDVARKIYEDAKSA
jgi:SNF2 family DNA or RNA helicase